ncbi:membrane protein [Streptomyces thermocoprophilus]
MPVLGHALAARRLHRMRLAALAAGAALILVLTVAGALGGFTAFLLVLWLLWATAFFRRVVTLQVLVRRLRPRSDGRFDGAYPEHPDLTRELVHKINRQQTADGTIIRYGGYKPFVGAGVPVRNWSNAQLLVGAPESPFEAGRPAPAVPGAVGRELRRKQVVPFTAEEMTARIAERMQQVLRDQTAADQRIDGLTVERSTFTTAVTTVRDVGRDPTPEDLDRPFVDDPPRARPCLSVHPGRHLGPGAGHHRVRRLRPQGQHPAHRVLLVRPRPPIEESFRLVDRLPERLDGKLLLKVAWHTLGGSPGATVRSAMLRTGTLVMPWKRDRVKVPQPLDTSEFGFGRYADLLVNRGAVTSVREMATRDTFRVFFQQTDTVKYTQIVERQLLHVIGEFLYEHNVDLAEYEARQTNILNQNFGSNNTFGSHSNFGPGNQFNNNSGSQSRQGA